MKYQEWLNIVDGFKFRSDGDARMMFEGAIIIRALLAENERLSALAATHLADQELLVAQERKGVARECAEIAETKGMNQDCSDACFYVYGKQIAKTIEDAIRDRFGVEG